MDNKKKHITVTKHMKNIINFIKNNNINDIKKNLSNIIYNVNNCDKILGSGNFGVVLKQGNNNNYMLSIKKNKIKVPLIIKDQLNDNDIQFNLNIINNVLYINGVNSITTEALILMYIRKLWLKTVNLPLILTFGTCINPNMINRICTIKYGLSKELVLNLENKVYNDLEIWNKNYIYNPFFKSHINNLYDLLQYIKYSRNMDGSVVLPNGIKCNISELVDNILISYFITYYLLNINNVYPSDLHAKNIFIHWLNKKSYYKTKNIQNIEEVFYFINKKYYKIKTFGFVIILGDLGTSIVKIKNNILLVGHINNFDYNYNLLPMIIDKFNNYIILGLLYEIQHYLSLQDFKNTIINEILSSTPYKDYPYIYNEYNIEYIKKLKTIPELLSLFDKKYEVNKYEKTNNNILINIKKYVN